MNHWVNKMFQLRSLLIVMLLFVIPIATGVMVQKGSNLLDGNYRQSLCSAAVQVCHPFKKKILPLPLLLTHTIHLTLTTPPQIYNGTTDPSVALQGLTINVAVNPDAPPFSFLFNSTNGGQPYDGFLYNIMMEMASRGGFQVNWIITAPYNSFSSGTQYMQTYLPYVDVYGNVASDTVARRALGIGFTTRVNDVSVILVTLQSASSASFNAWNFLSPFSSNIWLATFAVVVMSGVFRYLLNHWELYIDRLAHGGSLQWPNDGENVPIQRYVLQSFGDFVKIPTEGKMFSLPKLYVIIEIIILVCT